MVDELVGLTELAELLGVTRRTATRYAQRQDFPAPVGQLSRGRVWRRADVERWKKTHEPPLPAGRPPKPSA